MARYRTSLIAGVVALALGACAPAPIVQPVPPRPGQAGTSSSAGGRQAESQPSQLTSGSATAEAEVCAAKARALSPEEQVGQLLMVGVDTSGLDSATTDSIRNTKAGSVVLLGNSQVTRSDVAALSARIGALGSSELPILVAADQEGGAVQRLQGQGFTRMPDALAQGKMNPTALRSQTETWAEELSRAGVQFNLAPNADVVPTDKQATNEPIGKLHRQYGSDPDKVAESVVAFVQSMDTAHVATSLKHFPGLGQVTQHTDQGPATDTDTVVDDPGWKPFIAGIEAGASSVMISSATFQRIDPDHQAVFSKHIITDILRNQLRFDKVVIADDLGAAGAVADIPAGQRAVRFLEAGGDLILTADASLAPEMAEAVLEEMHTNTEFADSVAKSAARVLALKESVGELECR